MIQRKNIFVRIIPTILVLSVTLCMSILLYKSMIKLATQDAWKRLGIATENMADQIKKGFEDNINSLEHVAEAIALHTDCENQKNMRAYLATVQENPGSVYDRIDLIYPDGTLLTPAGEIFNFMGELSFDEIVSKGTHISPRYTDSFTGQEVIACMTPIAVDGEIVAVLCGVVDCKKLGEKFVSREYDSTAQVFLIDREDGNYLMDKWHSELDNMYQMESRPVLQGYEDVDFRGDIATGKTGTIAFVSSINGLAIYMSYMPVENFNWSVAVMAQEDKIFVNVMALKSLLMYFGIILVVLMMIYLVLNIALVSAAVKNEKRAKQAELEKVTNQAKANFLSSISHDIRTPLNGIVGMLDIINLHGDNAERLQDCLGKIRVSTQFLLNLTNDVLDLNEIESGKFLVINEPINLHRLAEDVEVLIRSRAEKAGITYYINHSRITHPDVLGSATHLNRILVNLITNAIKYNKENGEVWITIEEVSEKNGKGQYRFLVQDTGIGISEEFQRIVFNAFEQEYTDARTNYRGHGLGLTIVKQLVDKMGGTIELQSKKDEGSSFTVTLPMEIREVTEQEHREEKITDLKGFQILLAEDNEMNIEIATILLTNAGAKIISAVNGRRAVEMFADSEPYSFDLILMDVMMPEMDGCEATRVIRSMDRPDAKTIPILAMTAGVFSEDIQRCREAGMNEHLAKPVDIKTLLRKVSKYRKRK